MASEYGFYARVGGDFEQAVERVTAALKEEGFGVLTEIDVQGTLKAKLGVEKPPYRILGACNPQLANRVLDADPDAGLLLPCNVVVRRDGESNVVGFMDPDAVIKLTTAAGIGEVAAEARERLQRVCAALQE